MPHIDCFFTTLSPYAYLAGDRLETVAAKHGATVTYKPFDLITAFGRTGGQAPKDRHPSRQEYRAIELTRQSKKLGMPFNLKPAHWPTNAAPSCYAIIAAQNEGGDVGKLCQLFMAAVWAENRDIAQDDVVRDCLEKAGFNPDIAEKGMLQGADTFARNLEEAVEKGVFGAPFYILDDGQKFWGQDRLEDLDLVMAGKL
ncbi:DsbA family protein [Sulfitobacter sp.]|jgi:2-hydroxychromene-2-carboxylate isomerase|uniref:DsbA family protein n=1 Tax=Sulfitobacter sp. TaxID=1903071 RepID=UPI000C0F3D72|nr:2-hydroxychromene-2-carboxylate isomerase [Roseobacter sp.]MBV48669.1 2-hydroxychromene-2-carboxylate isomerase [Roseobacter sp.]PHR05071.1 MAG: 2-hydroxychromene-2-carboxylate isomerase [Sulfitobacter sp.]|tara:strand:- start:7129 stop:7725 length:597 start_codon:yes stop_codon:yes gene_type:complete